MDRLYYAQKLRATRLERVYALASARVKQYLQAEIDHAAGFIAYGDRVLELGCGYGRVLEPLARMAGRGWGIDNALESLHLCCQRDGEILLAAMDAAALGFKAKSFDVVVGVQNFISACQVPPRRLLLECLRIVRPGGHILLSSYAPEFWDHRLNWFRRQAREGLLGPIDEDATGDGEIVCRDGFRATTFSPEAFGALARDLDVTARIETVDESSIFCDIQVPGFKH